MNDGNNAMRVVFTVFLLLFAGAVQHWNLSTNTIAIAVLAFLPWLLPLIAQYVSKAKLPGGIELELQKAREDAAAAKETAAQSSADAALAIAAATGDVGKPPTASAPAPVIAAPAAGSRRAFSVPVAAEPGETAAPPPVSSDPNKGQFGGSSRAGGLELTADVTPVTGSPDWFRVKASVGPLQDGAGVTFHLHHTFRQPVVTVQAANGVATIERLAWGAFTIGAEIGATKLELDLAQLPSAPALFKSR